MKNSLFLTISLITTACLTSSCATVVRGTDETAVFQSTPSGAMVTVESLSEDKLGPYMCVTPCQLELKRKRTWKVDYTLEGYKPASGVLKPVVTGGGVTAGAGNILIGGLIGVGIDAGTGANLDLRPNPMIAELVKTDTPYPSRIVGQAPPAQAQTDKPTPNDDTPTTTDTQATPTTEEGVTEPDETSDLSSTTPIMNSGAVTNINNNKPTNDNTWPASLSKEAKDDPSAAQPRLYKPGERAPNDEVSDALNRQQLEKTKKHTN